MLPRLVVALVLLSGLHAGVHGAETLLAATLPAESITAAQRRAAALNLAREAVQRLKDENPVTAGLQEQLFTEAIDDYQRLVEESGDKLLPLDPRERQHCVQARWLCALDLSRLPAPALRVYRNRVDNQARKWLDRGRSERDVASLRRIVEEAFCSSYGDDALDLLGDLAFERGHFEEAERWWRHIARPAGETDRNADSNDLELIFPDPDVDVARVRAKQFLARLFGGVPADRLQADLQAFRDRHPRAEGVFTGRKGNYADLLETLAARPESAGAAEGSWPTFAGNSERGRVLPTDSRDPNRLLWLVRNGETHRFSLDNHVRLPPLKPDALPPAIVGKPIPVQVEARRLAFHPVIVGAWVVTANGRSVTAHHAVTGATHTWDLTDGKHRVPPRAPTVLPPLPNDPQQARTDAVYDLRCTLTAADGKLFVRLGAPMLGPDLKGEDAESYLACLDLPPGRDARWVARARDGDADRLTLFEGAPVVAGGRVYIAATRFAAGQTITSVRCYPADGRANPPIRWQQDVCSAAELRPGEVRYRHHLLTLAGPNLVYCSHNGAIAALDARSGRPAWAVRYPSRGLRLGPHELTPRDLTPCVYTAGRIYAAPADHDRLMCLDPVSGKTLWERRLEVVHLYGVSLGRLVFATQGGLRAIDAATGKDVGGWIQPAVGGALQPPAGEGLAVGIDDGLPSFGRGMLAGELVFWPTRRRLWVLSVRDGEQPDDLIPGELERVPPGNLVLGEGVLAVAGTDVLTIFTSPALLKAKRAAAVRAAPESPQALYDLGAACADAGEFSAALREFKLAERNAGDHFHFAEEARRRQREVLQERAAELRSVGRWQEVDATLAAASGGSARERLAREAERAVVWQEAGQPAKAVAVWQALLEKAPPQSHERRTAIARLDALIRQHGRAAYAAVETRAMQARAEAKRIEDLEQIATRFPNATSTATVLLELAQRYSLKGREGMAAHALRVAARQPDSPSRQPALAQLTQSYARRGVQDSCEEPCLQSLPLTEGWQVPLPPGEQVLAAAEAAAFFSDGGRLTCREIRSGAIRWTRTLPNSVTWAARHADTLLVAGPTDVSCLTCDDGTILWRLTRPGSSLSAFQLAAGRLFFLENGRRLVAAEADTGDILWSLSAPGWTFGGCFEPRFLAAGEQLLAQTRSGQRWILDARTGTVRHQSTAREPWPRPPLLLGKSRVALVEDARTVTLLNLADGQQLGHPVSGPSTLLSGTPPLLAGNPQVLAIVQFCNHGTTLQCFDGQTGVSRWPAEQQVSRHPVDCLTIDETAVYVVGNGVVSAFALRDGKRLWQAPLAGPGAGWRLQAGEGGLIVYPTELGLAEVTFDWFPGRLSLTLLPGAPGGVRFSGSVLDLATGQLLQRIQLPRAGPQLAARAGSAWMPRGTVVHRTATLLPLAEGVVGSIPGLGFGRTSR